MRRAAPVAPAGGAGALLRRRRGQAMVEFALVLPILVVIMMAIIEFGFLLREYLAVNYMLSQVAKEASLLRGVQGGDIRVMRTMLENSGGLDPDRLRFVLGNGTSYGPVRLAGTDVTTSDGTVIEPPATSLFFLDDNGTPGDTSDDSAAAAGEPGADLAVISISFLHRNLGPYPDFMGLREFTFTQSKTVRLE